MLDHMGLTVSNYDQAKQFYARALAPLGYRVEFDDPEHHAFGLGVDGAIDVWVTQGATPSTVHLAFKSPDRRTVDAFHERALTAGGRDHGSPGLRPDYGPDYYAAYVLDPDGNNIELVCTTKS